MSYDARRLVPTAAAGVLLVIAALGATAPPARPPAPVPDALYYPNCSLTLETGPFDQTWTTYGAMRFIQPFVAGRNVAACSLYVGTGYSGQVSIEFWDPVALAPDPSSLQLCTQWFQVSGSAITAYRMDLVPPLITKVVRGTAEPPRATLALDYLAPFGGYTNMGWSPNGPPSVPGALGTFGTYLLPLPGPHPVLAHWVCGGDSVLQGLYVTQSVVRSDAMLDSVECYAQRFRVPTQTQVSFVEMAFGVPDTRFAYQTGVVAILDAEGVPEPPKSAVAPLAQGVIPVGSTQLPSWASHTDFTSVAVLEPDHDYWLWVETFGRWRMYSRKLSGAEGPDFTAGIGTLYHRTAIGQSFEPDAGLALDFRIVGVPQDPTAVPGPAATVLSPLRLRVMPNPTRGASLVTWSGASGVVRFEVLDERGRRVAGADAGGGEQGQWRWRGTSDAGQRLPAGVYFLRATDAAGHAAVERLVLLR